MSWVLYATGAALVPCVVLGLAFAAMAPAGRRGEALRHPVRMLLEELRSNNE